MVGRIAPQHRTREIALRALELIVGLEQWREAIAAITRITQARDDVVVAREDPEAHGILVNGILLAQSMVEGVRVRVELGEARVEDGIGCRHESSAPLRSAYPDAGMMCLANISICRTSSSQ